MAVASDRCQALRTWASTAAVRSSSARTGSKRGFSAVIIADPYRLRDVVDEHFAVADLPRARRIRQGLHHFIQSRVCHHQLELDLRQQIDVVLLTAIDLFV